MRALGKCTPALLHSPSHFYCPSEGLSVAERISQFSSDLRFDLEAKQSTSVFFVSLEFSIGEQQESKRTEAVPIQYFSEGSKYRSNRRKDGK